MNPLCRRHYSNLIRPNLKPINFSSSTESQILQHCKSDSLSQALQLLNSVDSREIVVKPILYASLLQTCTKVHLFSHGIQIQAHLIKSGLETDRFVGNSLLALYFKLGPNFSETRRVFDCLFVKDVVSWTSMISGYIRVGKPRNSIGLFSEMLDFGVEPNGFTLSALIKACSEIGDVNIGRCFHGVVFRRGFDLNYVIASALIDMYGRNYESGDARQVFDELLEPDAICWTSVISALTRNDSFEDALGFFYSMQRIYGLSPDEFTFGTVLTACGNLGWLRQGKEVHAKVIMAGIFGNVVVESSLVDMYGKCRLVDESQRVFDRMTLRNSVSCCALLGGYCQRGDFDTVIELFRELDEVNLYSFGTVLRACAGLAAVRQGKEVHCQYLRRGGWSDVIVESALVDLYAKCGCIDFAYRIFVQMPVRNLITWNSMICGFAQNGRAGEALRMFDEMVKEGINPDYISFIGVLFACSHTGLVDQGRGHFTSMTEQYRIKAGIEHYNCMVDLLGRSGQIEEAEYLINSAEFKDDSSLWAALLGACSTSTNSVVAERIAKKMMELEPDYHLSYVLLANVYRAVGRWSDALKIWRLMQGRGVKKMPGKSWI
ncbi:pentatricopeptide repeat-containing protein At1g03540-like [Actinidia eriantha]|uniref:pentatricopeptide repeat-containing protein At1g03540-like n=1 Tax=Actinidia eriantha TaxID=165200 RepID=UPI00258C4305|nr:pentatricopeptide repeat-containing protein At1g03540-like [Actinidia eriantha]XP_057505710.1 pentatricopeptide repeat-containing protein At1g03540-like [Actinidia eriantha]